MTDGQRVNYGDGKEALLRATVDVVARKGLRGLTFRAVAEEAGVNNTLIAHHFGNRDALLAAALEWTADRSISAADLGDYEHSGAETVRAVVQHVLTQPEVEVFQYEMILEATRREELRPAVHALYRQYVAAMSPGIAGGEVLRDENLRRAVFAALDGLAMQFFSRAITAEQFADAMRALQVAMRGSGEGKE